MSFDGDAVIIPGRGTVLIAAPDTPFPDYKTVDPEALTGGPTGWSALGHTSRDNNVGLTVEGGEATTKGSWWTPNLYTTRSPRVFGFTANALQITPDSMALAFGGGEINDTTGGYEVPAQVIDVQKAVFILAIGSDGTRMAIGFNRASISLGDVPSFDVENFFELPLSGQVLASVATPSKSQTWFHPKLDAV